MNTATLIKQLGTALPMMGAKDLVEFDTTTGSKGLQFKIRGCKTGNKLVITLAADDTYSIALWHVKTRGCNIFQVGENR